MSKIINAKDFLKLVFVEGKKQFRYWHNHIPTIVGHDRCIELNDFINVCFIAACQAIKKYDSKKGCNIFVYLITKMRFAIIDFLNDYKHVKTPRDLLEGQKEIEKVKEILRQELTREPRIEEILDFLVNRQTQTFKRAKKSLQKKLDQNPTIEEIRNNLFYRIYEIEISKIDMIDIEKIMNVNKFSNSSNKEIFLNHLYSIILKKDGPLTEQQREILIKYYILGYELKDIALRDVSEEVTVQYISKIKQVAVKRIAKFIDETSSINLLFTNDYKK